MSVGMPKPRKGYLKSDIASYQILSPESRTFHWPKPRPLPPRAEAPLGLAHMPPLNRAAHMEIVTILGTQVLSIANIKAFIISNLPPAYPGL